MDNLLRTASGASPIDAGLGLVRAGTVVATTNDLLSLDPPGEFTLTVGGSATSGTVAELHLAPGKYDAVLRCGEAAKTPVTLILIDPSSLRRRFGARYCSLEYDLPVVTGPGETVAWASLWKTGEVADIVVDFDAPWKFVLWRGMSFAPSWAMDNVMTCNFFAETVEPGTFRDCCEMMSDRQCRYIHARVIHSTDARVVIHWRYPLNDSDYAICRDQWVDEMFFIYPDGVAVRNVTIHLDPSDDAVWRTCPQTGRRVPANMIDGPEGKRTFNDMEFITVNAPGATSDDNTPPDALTIMDTRGFSQTYRWPDPPNFAAGPLPELSEYILRMNYRRRPGVFLASPAVRLQVRFQPNVGMRYVAGQRVEDDRWENAGDLPSNFADHIHWPVTRGYGTCPLTDPAEYLDRPTHTFLGFAHNGPVDVRADGAVTWRWMSGIAPADDADLRARAGSWLRPTPIQGARYDPREAAYVVTDADSQAGLVVKGDRPAVRPTLILPGWQKQDPDVTIEGAPAPRASCGIEQAPAGPRTVVTLRANIPPGATIRIR